MNCKKYKLTNNESTPQFFSYQRCTDSIWNNHVQVNPNQSKSVNVIDGTFSSTNKLDIWIEGVSPSMSDVDLELLGRLQSVDVRDLNFLIDEKIPFTAPSTTSKFWQNDVWSGDQGRNPTCVGYAWAHFIEDGPITHKGKHPVVSPEIIYKEAQKVDEWPGENYAGTSVRAGAKYLRSQNKIASYLWGYNLNTLVNTVLNVSPVVVGTNWYYGMFFPNKDGQITISGPLAGGHAYLINGVDTQKQIFRLKNSWGKKWGKDGHAFITFSDMTKLINEKGEICLATEMKF